jgi:ATP-binding cassette subfamily B protein
VDVVGAFGTALAGALVSVAVPLVIKHVIDIVTNPATAAGSVDPWVAVLIAAAVLQYALTFTRRFLAGRLSLDVQYDLRTDIFRSLQRLDGAGQDRLQTGQVVSRSISDIGLVQGLLSFLPALTGNVLLFAISLVAMVLLSPLLTLIAVAVAPALWFVARASRRDLFPANWSAQQQSGELVGHVEAAVTGVRVVKGFGQERREVNELSDQARTLFALRMRVVRLQARYSAALSAIPAMGQVGVLLLGGWLALHGQITIGTFLAFSTYLGQLVSPVRQLAGLLTIGPQARAGVERVLEILDSSPAVVDPADARPLPDGPLGITFTDVHFGYPRSGAALDGLSLSVRPGETMAVVGGAGSGKSTMAMLVPRFYDVAAGSVQVGGVDVDRLRLDELRAAIGMVFEDSFLFSASIADNIAYGRPDATEAQIIEAARAAEADEFVSALPEGYRTLVGERGLTLSGGQRQRVALARALLTESRIMLLDDATSAIDPRVEAQILRTLRGLIRNRTTVLIAHRRSTLALADRIAVLDGGRVAELGTFDELMARSPLFRSLVGGPLAGDGTDPTAAADRRGGPADAAGAAGADRSAAGPVSAALWQPVTAAPAVAEGALRAPALLGGAGLRQPGSRGAGRRGVGGGASGELSSVPATAELLAKVAALPPATEQPAVDEAAARAADPSFGLRRLLHPLRRVFAAGILLIGLDTVLQLVVPSLIRTGIDRGVSDHRLSALVAVSAVALLVLLVDWVVSAAGQRVTGRTGERLLYTLRVKSFAHLQRLGLDYYERELGGRIMTRMTTDVDALSNFLQTGLATALISVLTLVGVLVALLLLDLQLALILVVMLPALFLATYAFRQLAVPAYVQSRDRVSAVNAQFQEDVAGLRVAQAFGRERRNAANFAALSRSYRDSRLRAQTYISAYFPFVQLLADLAGALVLAFGARRLSHGTLSPGALIAFFLYLDAFFGPVQQLSQVFDGYQQASVGLSRLKDLLRTPTSTPRADRPRPVQELRGEICFHDVDFAYTADSAPAVHGIDLHIPAGQSIALVGQTGAGKSTLVKLIARFYDPTRGTVTVDGTDLRELDLTGYRQRLGFVPQEAYLSAGSVRDAIAYGRPGATDAEVERAARAVGAHDMIATLSGGYLHDVGERGRNLSAGQRQLIALARAELVEPDLLLLDEATAALDLASEAAVTDATRRLARHRTTVTVAHRLTTAARADRILVLAGGQVVEDGSHHELVRAGGRYALLWQSYLAGNATSDSVDVVAEVTGTVPDHAVILD